MIEKYLEVAKYYCASHPIMVTVFVLGVMAIALMVYAADRDIKDFTDGK